MHYYETVMTGNFCEEYDNVVGPPPIPPADFITETDCKDIIASCSSITSCTKLLNYSDGCPLSKLSSAATTVTETVTSQSTSSHGFDFTSLSETTTTAKISTLGPVLNNTKTPLSILNAGGLTIFHYVLIGLAVVLVLSLVIVIVYFCKKKSAANQRFLSRMRKVFSVQYLAEKSPERSSAYALSEYNRINYLHNKLENGERYKRKGKSKQNGIEDNGSNNNVMNGSHVISMPPIATVHGTGNQFPHASPPGYDEFSRGYARGSAEGESDIFFKQDLNGGAWGEKQSRIYTPTIIDDVDPDKASFYGSADGKSDSHKDLELQTNKGSFKESPYAVSDVLPNVPLNDTDDEEDLPPPAPHGMYANHQFEKLQGVSNKSFVSDEEHRSKPLPPNPFPDLRSHTSLYGVGLLNGAGETDKQKKKKPIPKKRQKKQSKKS